MAQADKITLGHGDGGILTHNLVRDIFHKYFANPILQEMNDAAILALNAPNQEGIPRENGSLAFTTDSFVVKPIFFRGGDIGKLAVAGTVNDLAVTGAIPKYLTAGFILQEGFPLADLERIVKSMAETAHAAGVQIVAGDTKVVEQDAADQIFINTSGLGFRPVGWELGYRRVQAGDLVIINGNIAEHGIAILSERNGLQFKTPVLSDCQALNKLTTALMTNFAADIKLMRDPTRGGVATTVKEIAESTQMDIWLYEESLPISPVVQGAAEMLGLDPLYLANEGKVLVIVKPEQAGRVLAEMQSTAEGRNAVIIGEVQAGTGNLYLRTTLGGTKILNMMAGAPLPRIC